MTPDVGSDVTGDDPDRCLCGAVVAPHWSGVPGSGVTVVERGSCTSCGLQLVRRAGEPWRHVRG